MGWWGENYQNTANNFLANIMALDYLFYLNEYKIRPFQGLVVFTKYFLIPIDRVRHLKNGVRGTDAAEKYIRTTYTGHYVVCGVYKISHYYV